MPGRGSNMEEAVPAFKRNRGPAHLRDSRKKRPPGSSSASPSKQHMSSKSSSKADAHGTGSLVGTGTASSSSDVPPDNHTAPAARTFTVGLRVRPFLRDEDESLAVVEAVTDNTAVLYDGGGHRVKLKFDHVFGPRLSQEDAYEKICRDLLRKSLRRDMHGFLSPSTRICPTAAQLKAREMVHHFTCFAYGPTGSGKTYTMFGEQYRWGVIPQALVDIFDSINGEGYFEGGAGNSAGRMANGAPTNRRVYCSFLELYNETLLDLLDAKKKCDLREDATKCSITGQQKVGVKNVHEAMQVMEMGLQNRQTGFNGHHIRSSRSHAIFQLVVEEELLLQDSFSDKNHYQQEQPMKRVLKMHFIDLAGSERIDTLHKNNNCNEKQREKELASINQSLSTLNLCIARLSRQSRDEMKAFHERMAGVDGSVTGSKSSNATSIDSSTPLGKLTSGGSMSNGKSNTAAKSHKQFIPYRSSKLTRVLRDAFQCEDSQIRMIVCVAPTVEFIEQTIQAVKFAERARQVRATVLPPPKKKTESHYLQEQVKSLQQELIQERERRIKLERLLTSTSSSSPRSSSMAISNQSLTGELPADSSLQMSEHCQQAAVIQELDNVIQELESSTGNHALSSTATTLIDTPVLEGLSGPGAAASGLGAAGGGKTPEARTPNPLLVNNSAGRAKLRVRSRQTSGRSSRAGSTSRQHSGSQSERMSSKDAGSRERVASKDRERTHEDKHFDRSTKRAWEEEPSLLRAENDFPGPGEKQRRSEDSLTNSTALSARYPGIKREEMFQGASPEDRAAREFFYMAQERQSPRGEGVGQGRYNEQFRAASTQSYGSHAPMERSEDAGEAFLPKDLVASGLGIPRSTTDPANTEKAKGLKSGEMKYAGNYSNNRIYSPERRKNPYLYQQRKPGALLGESPQRRPAGREPSSRSPNKSLAAWPESPERRKGSRGKAAQSTRPAQHGLASLSGHRRSSSQQKIGLEASVRAQLELSPDGKQFEKELKNVNDELHDLRHHRSSRSYLGMSARVGPPLDSSLPQKAQLSVGNGSYLQKGSLQKGSYSQQYSKQGGLNNSGNFSRSSRQGSIDGSQEVPARLLQPTRSSSQKAHYSGAGAPGPAVYSAGGTNGDSSAVLEQRHGAMPASTTEGAAVAGDERSPEKILCARNLLLKQLEKELGYPNLNRGSSGNSVSPEKSRSPAKDRQSKQTVGTVFPANSNIARQESNVSAYNSTVGSSEFGSRKQHTTAPLLKKILKQTQELSEWQGQLVHDLKDVVYSLDSRASTPTHTL